MKPARKLYKVVVELEFDMVIVADGEEAARKVAKDVAEDEFRNYSLQDLMYVNKPIEIKTAADIPADWPESIAYGDNPGEHTTAALFFQIHPQGQPK